METTRQLLKRGLKPLEKTPSGRSSGPEGKRSDYPWIKASDWKPPRAVQANADEGLALRMFNEESRGLKRPGGTDIGVARAVQLSSGKTITPRAAKRMAAYFSRHQKDKQATGWGDFEKPSPGFVAWCLTGDAEVLLADGEVCTIREIVDAKLDVKVLAWDGEKLVPDRIVGWHVRQSSIEDFVRVGRHKTRRTPMSPFSYTKLDITPEHEMLTPLGWSCAGDMQGKKHGVAERWLDAVGEQVLFGTILGDASAGAFSQGLQLKMCHGDDQVEWLKEKARLLSPLITACKPTRCLQTSGYGAGRYTNFLASHISGYLGTALSTCLVDGQRRITPQFLGKLTDLGVAVWLLDDGSLHVDRRGGGGEAYSYRLHTEGFPQEDVDVAVSWFKSYLDSDRVTAIQRENTEGQCIYFGREASQILARKIAPFVPPSMRRKLPVILQGAPYELESHDPVSTWRVAWQETTRLEPCSGNPSLIRHFRKRYEKRYDITTERFHSFVADGFVVHNCLWGGDEGWAWANRLVAMMKQRKNPKKGLTEREKSQLDMIWFDEGEEVSDIMPKDEADMLLTLAWHWGYVAGSSGGPTSAPKKSGSVQLESIAKKLGILKAYRDEYEVGYKMAKGNENPELIWGGEDGDEIDEDPWDFASEQGVNVLSHLDFHGGFVNDDGELIGVLFTGVSGDDYEFDLAVRPDYRRQGLASELMDIALSDYEENLEWNPDLVFSLDVISPISRHMLEKRGFRVVGGTPDRPLMTRNPRRRR